MTVKQLDRFISTSILKSNPQRIDIEGAPYKIGDRVKVLLNPNNDETFEIDFSGKIGEVFFRYKLFFLNPKCQAAHEPNPITIIIKMFVFLLFRFLTSSVYFRVFTIH